MYPVTVTDDPTTDGDLYSFSALTLEISQGVGGTNSIGGPLVLIVVLFFLLYL